MTSNLRRLKVGSRGRDSRTRGRLMPLEPVPFLPLNGRWLAEAGFAIGSEVRVEVSQGRLVLELVPPEPPPPRVAKSSRAARRAAL